MVVFVSSIEKRTAKLIHLKRNTDSSKTPRPACSFSCGLLIELGQTRRRSGGQPLALEHDEYCAPRLIDTHPSKPAHLPCHPPKPAGLLNCTGTGIGTEVVSDETPGNE